MDKQKLRLAIGDNLAIDDTAEERQEQTILYAWTR